MEAETFLSSSATTTSYKGNHVGQKVDVVCHKKKFSKDCLSSSLASASTTTFVSRKMSICENIKVFGQAKAYKCSYIKQMLFGLVAISSKWSKYLEGTNGSTLSSFSIMGWVLFSSHFPQLASLF